MDVAASFSASLASGLLRRGLARATNPTEALPTLRLGFVLSRAWVARDAQTLARHRIRHCLAWSDLGHGCSFARFGIRSKYAAKRLSLWR